MITLSPNTLLNGGKYRIERTLGQGGFGITYLAEQVALGRRVAIKEFFMKEFCERGSDSHVSIGSSGGREMVERFRAKFIKEAQTIAQFNNSHIVRIYDIFEDNDTAYYVMEYHDGGSLADLVKSNGHLSEAKAVGYARQIADALGYLHTRKINHLDVKPANVLLNEDGDAVLIDFGLSKHYDSEGNQTSTTPVGISHGYAPMEQYKRGGVGVFSPTSDIYSLGATLYKMLTGITPPEASDVNDDGLPPMTVEVSPAVRNAVEQAMQPRRKDRPQSIGDFLSLLNGETPVVGVVDDEKTNVVVEDKTVLVADVLVADETIYPQRNNETSLMGGKKVGDIFELNGVKAIVFKVDDGGRHGVAMSLEEKDLNWDDARKWCSNLGSGWRMPSVEELKEIYRNREQLDKVLSQSGYENVAGWYWSSDEFEEDRSCAWNVGMYGGYTSNNRKSVTICVRAVCEF